ncbi:pyrimidine-nucleoside phosphorylase, partial [Staphylococcus epidermidis]
SQMVVVGGKAQNLDEARKMLEQAIQDGSALESFRTFLENQDGDGSVVDDVSKLPQAKYQIELPAQSEGIVTEIIANEVGVA